MSTESIDAVMKRFVEFINTADEQLARQVIAPEAEFDAPTHGEPLRGPAGYLELLAMLRNGFPRHSLDFGRDDHRRRQGGCAV